MGFIELNSRFTFISIVNSSILYAVPGMNNFTQTQLGLMNVTAGWIPIIIPINNSILHFSKDTSKPIWPYSDIVNINSNNSFFFERYISYPKINSRIVVNPRNFYYKAFFYNQLFYYRVYLLKFTIFNNIYNKTIILQKIFSKNLIQSKVKVN